MSFRKFGRSDDQKVLTDDKDTQGVRKEGNRQWTAEDERELARENEQDSRK